MNHLKSYLTISILIFFLFQTNLIAQNRLNSRLFYDLPKLYDSNSHFSGNKGYPVSVVMPEDRRTEFYGENVYKRVKVQFFKDFWIQPITAEIQKKIKKDLNLQFYDKIENEKFKFTIYPIIEVFYTDVRGFIWAKSFAKVRLHFKVMDKENIIILDKKYESFYISAGTDKEWEGKIAETIENSANITIGIALRKTLDDFYKDLDNLL
jgi:hypothetical protein